jgi:hypothetical protein
VSSPFVLFVGCSVRLTPGFSSFLRNAPVHVVEERRVRFVADLTNDVFDVAAMRGALTQGLGGSFVTESTTRRAFGRSWR